MSVHNRMVIYRKTKELVFWLPNPRLVVHPIPLDQVEQVCCGKLLHVYLSDMLLCETHIITR